MNKSIALLGEYSPTFQPHLDTDAAIKHSRAILEAEIKSQWVSTQDIDERLFEQFSAIWVVPGSPYKNADNLLWAIQHARENQVPCFGTCGGVSYIIIEYVPNGVGDKKTQNGEKEPHASQIFLLQL